jgi:hypothetical protein
MHETTPRSPHRQHSNSPLQYTCWLDSYRKQMLQRHVVSLARLRLRRHSLLRWIRSTWSLTEFSLWRRGRPILGGHFLSSQRGYWAFLELVLGRMILTH